MQDPEVKGWTEADIPGLAAVPVRPNLRTRRLRDVVATAYHEAGHAAAHEAFGVGLSSIWITGEVARVEEMAGRCQADATDLIMQMRLSAIDQTAHDDAITKMAGSAAARRLGIPAGRLGVDAEGDTLEGVTEALDAGLDVQLLLREADAFVADHWERIEAIAVALLRSPDLALYPWRDSIIDTPRLAARRAEQAAWFAANPAPLS
jgi:hypothetical protein